MACSPSRRFATWSSEALQTDRVSHIDNREQRTAPDGFSWLAPPRAPYRYLGAGFSGRPTPSLKLPAKYELRLPQDRDGLRASARHFAVGRFFDDDSNLNPPLRSLLKWATAANGRDGIVLRSIQIYGRVTDDSPHFGLVLSPTVLAAIAASGAKLDLSMYPR